VEIQTPLYRCQASHRLACVSCHAPGEGKVKNGYDQVKGRCSNNLLFHVSADRVIVHGITGLGV
jgi:hypothetical protein